MAAWCACSRRCKLEGGNTHAYMHHWIYTLKHLGLNDVGVTTDYPLAVVFNQDGRRAYAAYNCGANPLTVTFSDGAKLLAQPQALAVKRGGQPP